MKNELLLDVKNLTKIFPILGGVFSKQIASVKAVNNISLSINRGETLGLVGESGCGKSTLGRSILRLIEPTSGEIYYGGRNLLNLNKKEMKQMRKRIQFIFQDPYASLNPRMTIREILSEPLIIHKLCHGKKEFNSRLAELLDYVQLPNDSLSKYPHEFSGGQRQRICIARALAVKPEFIVCDEPVSALDVSVQAQIINLMKDLQKQLELTYLFIAHDLKVVEFMSDRVAVMYLGNIVETAKAAELYHQAKHPYTRALISAIPVPNPEIKKERIVLGGDVPSPLNPPTGCHFHPRCQYTSELCRLKYPQDTSQTEGHFFKCHHPIE